MLNMKYLNTLNSRQPVTCSSFESILYSTEHPLTGLNVRADCNAHTDRTTTLSSPRQSSHRPISRQLPGLNWMFPGPIHIHSTLFLRPPCTGSDFTSKSVKRSVSFPVYSYKASIRLNGRLAWAISNLTSGARSIHTVAARKAKPSRWLQLRLKRSMVASTASTCRT